MGGFLMPKIDDPSIIQLLDEIQRRIIREIDDLRLTSNRKDEVASVVKHVIGRAKEGNL